jgi:hypothetical protein|nr:MAG TPA: hypothetical protein [Caudoviricetes sp.]
MNNIDFNLAEEFLTEFLYNETTFNEFESILQIDKVEQTLTGIIVHYTTSTDGHEYDSKREYETNYLQLLGWLYKKLSKK